MQGHNAVLEQTTTRQGAGLIASTFGYNADAQLTTLTTYPSGEAGNTDDAAAATTTWTYDPATGLLAAKDYASGPGDSYRYNPAGQLKTMLAPGMGASLGYDAAGIQTSLTAVDAATGLTSWQAMVTGPGKGDILNYHNCRRN